MAIFKNTVKAGQKAISKKDVQEIQKLAYQFFVNRGYKHGHDKEDWTKAEQIVRNRLS